MKKIIIVPFYFTNNIYEKKEKPDLIKKMKFDVKFKDRYEISDQEIEELVEHVKKNTEHLQESLKLRWDGEPL